MRVFRNDEATVDRLLAGGLPRVKQIDPLRPLG